VWWDIIWTERQNLFASPERVAWIEAHYSDADVGRPGILVSPARGEKLKIRKTDSAVLIKNADYDDSGCEDAVVEPDEAEEVFIEVAVTAN
jgi:hypothetical protein